MSRKITMFTFEFSDYKDSDARDKTMIFQLNTHLTSAVFPVKVLVEEIEFVVAEN